MIQFTQLRKYDSQMSEEEYIVFRINRQCWAQNSYKKMNHEDCQRYACIDEGRKSGTNVFMLKEGVPLEADVYVVSN